MVWGLKLGGRRGVVIRKLCGTFELIFKCVFKFSVPPIFLYRGFICLKIFLGSSNIVCNIALKPLNTTLCYNNT